MDQTHCGYGSSGVQATLILNNEDPRDKKSDAVNLVVTKRGHKGLPLSEKMKILYLLRKMLKNFILRLLRSM